MIAQYEKNILQFLVTKNVLTTNQAMEIAQKIVTSRQSQPSSINIIKFLLHYNYITPAIAQKLQEMLTAASNHQNQVSQINTESTVVAPTTGQIPQMGMSQNHLPQTNHNKIAQTAVDFNIPKAPEKTQENVDQTFAAANAAHSQVNTDQAFADANISQSQVNIDQTIVAPATGEIPQVNSSLSQQDHSPAELNEHVAKEITSYVEETAYPQSPPNTNHEIGNSQLGKTASSTSSFRVSQFNESTDGDQKMFRHYRIERELGRGGMGLVLLAYDTNLDRRVALKVIINEHNISEEQIRRFAIEARATAKLKHPNIVEVYEAGNTPKNYFTMEYIKGKPFSSLIQKGNLKAADIAAIMKKSADAISYAYREHKVIHRDIKPSNIMMDGKEPKIMDFGLAKEMDRDEELSRDGGMMGTLGYMPPEQIDNDNVGHYSDVYALGATLYNALTGRPPFQGGSYYMILNQIHNDDPMPPSQLTPGIPKELEAICLKCLQKKPQNRYKSAKDLSDDLDNFLYNRPVNAKPPSLAVKGYKWIKRNKVKTAAFSSFAVVLLLIIFMVSYNNAVLKQEKDKVEKARVQEREARVKEQEARALEQKARAKEKKALREVTFSKIDSVVKQYQLTIMAGQFAAQDNKVATTARYLYGYENEEQSVQQLLRDVKKRGDYEQLVQEAPERIQHILQRANTGKPLQNRGWEWNWLNTIAKKKYTQLSHGNKVTACVYLETSSRVIFGDSVGRVLSVALPITEKSEFELWGRPDKEDINQLAVSPDQKYLLSGTDGRNLFLWDVQSRKVIRTYNNDTLKGNDKSRRVTSCVFAHDSRHFYVGYKKRDKDMGFQIFNSKLKDLAVSRFANVILWSVDSKKAQHEYYLYTNKKKGDGFAHSATSLAISPDGTRLAVGRENLNMSVVIVDTKTHREKHLKGHKDTVSDVVFSKDGKFLISTDKKGTVIVRDAKKFRLLKEISAHRGKITSCAVHPQSHILALASVENEISLWNLRNLQKITSLTVNKSEINDIIFDNAGENIIFGGDDSTLTYLSLKSTINPLSITDKKIFTYAHFHPKNSDVVFSSHTKENLLLLWDTKQQPLYPNTINIMSIAINNAGDKIALAGQEGRALGIVEYENVSSFIDILSKTTSFSFNHKKIVRIVDIDRKKMMNCAFHPLEPLILAGQDYNSKKDASYSGLRALLHLFSTESNTDKAIWSAYFDDKIDQCLFSPDGKQICVLSDKKMFVKSYDSVAADIAKNKAQVDKISKMMKRLGKRQAEREIERQKREMSKREQGALEFFVEHAIARLKGRIAKPFLSEYDFKEHREQLQDKENVIKHASYSPDGKYIAIATDSSINNLMLLDSTTLETVAVLEDHLDQVNCCNFSPDGKRLVSCSRDQTVRIWDVENITAGTVKNSLLTLRKHTGEVYYCTFSHDGKNIASCGTEELFVWKTQ